MRGPVRASPAARGTRHGDDRHSRIGRHPRPSPGDASARPGGSAGGAPPSRRRSGPRASPPDDRRIGDRRAFVPRGRANATRTSRDPKAEPVKIVQPVSRTAAPLGPSIANTAKEAIEYYLRAKDENLPWLMESAFAASATLEVIVNAGTLAFPPVTHRPAVDRRRPGAPVRADLRERPHLLPHDAAARRPARLLVRLAGRHVREGKPRRARRMRPLRLGAFPPRVRGWPNG